MAHPHKVDLRRCNKMIRAALGLWYNHACGHHVMLESANCSVDHLTRIVIASRELELDGVMHWVE